MKIEHKIAAWAGGLLFIGLFVAYTFEYQWIENTFGAGKLVGKSIAVGVGCGLSLAWYLRKNADDLESRLRLWSSCVLIAAFFSPLFGSLSNRFLSPHPVEMRPFEFWEEKPYATRLYGIFRGEKTTPDGYYIFVMRDGELKRLKSKTPRFGHLQRGDRVELPVKRGLWKHDFVLVKQI